MRNVVPIKSRPGPGEGASLEARSDDELMLLVRGGAKAALATLATRHVGRLTSFCAKMLSNRAAADDIVQEVWVRLWAHRATFQAQGKFVVLLYTIARNLCRNHARASRRRGRWLPEAPDLTLELVPDGASDHLARLLERERQRDAQRMLAELSEPMREAILLKFHDGLAYGEIAAVVGASESTVRSRVFHGLKQLRARLTQGAQP